MGQWRRGVFDGINRFRNFVVLPLLCTCVGDLRERERADGDTEIRKWWKEAISIWRSAIDTEKRLAEASPFPDEFSPTRRGRGRRPSRIDLSGGKTQRLLATTVAIHRIEIDTWPSRHGPLLLGWKILRFSCVIEIHVTNGAN